MFRVFRFRLPDVFPLRASSRRSTKNTGFMRSAPLSVLAVARDARPRAPARAHANRPFFEAQNRRLAWLLRPGCVQPLRPPPRRKQNCFYACVHLRSHTTGNHRFAEPVVSHKNSSVPCARPGARSVLSALRLINPLALGPQSWGPARWSGRQRLARLDTLPALPGRRSGDKFTTHGLRGGFFLLCKNPRNPPRPDHPAHHAPAKPSRGVRTARRECGHF